MTESATQRAHDRIDRVEGDVRSLRTSVAELARGQEAITTQMQEQHGELRDLLRQNTTTTLTDVSKIMQVIVMGGAILSATIGGIIYVSGNANSARLALLEYKMSSIFGTTRWSADWKRNP